jgi:Ala-tRNA(Pro) deacylase
VVNDPAGNVEVVIDEDLWTEAAFQCHPLVNTSTLVLSREALMKVFAATGHTPRVLLVQSKT